MDSPPWYFIGQDFVTGICYAGGLAIFLVVVAFTWKNHAKAHTFLVPMAIIWMGYPIAYGIIAVMRTDNLLDSSLATSDFESFAEYIGDPLRATALKLSTAIGFVALILLLPYQFLHDFRDLRKNCPDCPTCDQPLSILQSPLTKTKRQWREGGYVCKNCGCQVDLAGKEVPASPLPDQGKVVFAGVGLLTLSLAPVIVVTWLLWR